MKMVSGKWFVAWFVFVGALSLGFLGLIAWAIIRIVGALT